MLKFTVAGIGTEVGKTVVSAFLCEALGADYWKPIQAGDLDHTDTDKVRALVSHTPFIAHPETHRLTQPMSPHAAAQLDNVAITPGDFHLPDTEDRPLIAELAGGLMVPLNNQDTNLDLIKMFGFPVVLVANYYLGSINHTLMSIETIKQHGVSLAGLIFTGECNRASRDVIVAHTGVRVLADIPQAPSLDKTFIKTHAHTLRDAL